MADPGGPASRDPRTAAAVGRQRALSQPLAAAGPGGAQPGSFRPLAFLHRHGAFLRRLGIGAGRAALLAYAAHTALSVLPGLLKRRRLPPRSAWLGPDSLRLAAFFGSFSGIHTLCSGLLGLPDWGAGLLCGFSLGLAPRRARMPVALFGAVRALEVCARALWAKGCIPHIPHADALTMILASVQCVYAWIYEPQSLDPSYLGFLYRFGGHPIPVVQAVCADTRGQPVDEATVLPLLQREGLATEWSAAEFCGPRGGHWCQLAHAHTTSCLGGYLSFWLKSIRHCVPLYVPVFAVPLVFAVVQRLFRKRPVAPQDSQVNTAAAGCGSEAKPATDAPPEGLFAAWERHLRAPPGAPFGRWFLARVLHSILGVLRSAAFLATYCSNGWGSVCMYRALRGSVHPSAGCWSGFWCGLCVLIEAPARRIELALYVLMHALQSAGNLWVPSLLRLAGRSPGQPLPWLLRPHVFAVLLFAASSAFLRPFRDVASLPRSLPAARLTEEGPLPPASPASPAKPVPVPARPRGSEEAGRAVPEALVVRPTTGRLLRFLFA